MKGWRWQRVAEGGRVAGRRRDISLFELPPLPRPDYYRVIGTSWDLIIIPPLLPNDVNYANTFRGPVSHRQAVIDLSSYLGTSFYYPQ